jgi:hypothetical protein
MVASLLSIVGAFFALTGKIFEWLYAKDLVNAGKTQQQLDALSKQVKDAQIAVAAREAVRAAAAADPDSLPDDDGFRRD